MKVRYAIEEGTEGFVLWIDAINGYYTSQKFTTTKSQELYGWGELKNKTVQKLLVEAEIHLLTLSLDVSGMYIMPEDVRSEQLWVFVKVKT